jgi:hypothetical protein
MTTTRREDVNPRQLRVRTYRKKSLQHEESEWLSARCQPERTPSPMLLARHVALVHDARLWGVSDIALVKPCIHVCPS